MLYTHGNKIHLHSGNKIQKHNNERQKLNLLVIKILY